MSDKISKLRLASMLAVLSLLLSSCVSLYKPDVQQGNVISAEMLETLKTGMTKRQVVFLLGTPLIVDPFHPERWDYFYSLSKNGRKPAQRHLVVYFKGDAMVSLDGDLAPQNTPPNTPPNTKSPDSAGQS